MVYWLTRATVICGFLFTIERAKKKKNKPCNRKKKKTHEKQTELVFCFLRKFDGMRLAFFSRVALRFSRPGQSSCWPTDPLPVVSPGSAALRAAALLAVRWAGGSAEWSCC